MRIVLITVLAMFSFWLTGCASVTIEGGMPDGSQSTEPAKEQRLSEADKKKIIAFATNYKMALQNNASTSFVSAICDSEENNNKDIEKAFKVFDSMGNTLAILDEKGSDDAWKVKIDGKFRKSAMENLSMFQNGELERYVMAGDMLFMGLAEAQAANTKLTNSCFNYTPEQIAEVYSFPAYLFAYLKAYFRGGNFALAKLDANSVSEKLSTDIVKKFKEAIGYDSLGDAEKQAADTMISKLTASVSDRVVSVCKGDNTDECLISNPLGEVALITKGGRSLQFGGVEFIVGKEGEALISADKPKSTDIAAQIIEVIIEAGMDSRHQELPALETSTACVANLISGDQYCKKASDFSEDDKKIYEKGNVAAGYANAVASILVRGGYFFSLDNEAAAKVIETGAASVARKKAEVRQYYSNAGDGKSNVEITVR